LSAAAHFRRYVACVIGYGGIQRLSVGRLSNQCIKLTKWLLRLKAMLYMVIEYFNAGAAVEIYRRARDRGRQLPPGLEYVDSWVDLDYFRCFQLMRTDDRALFDIWIEAWSDLGHFEIIPVRTSAEAAQHIGDKL
jgi:Protein of unknown function (DUF3303)